MAKQLLTKFSGGEVSPDLFGRVDSDLYFASGERVQNFLSRQQGPLVYRGGSQFGHSTASNNACRLERFRFNDEQVYIFEFTNLKVRIYEDAALTLSTSATNITGATQADPVVVTDVGHPYSDGEEIFIDSVVGMTELNGRFFRVNNSGVNDYELTDLFDNDVDGSGFTAYSSGGTSTIVLELTTPFTTAQLFEFQFDQQGNEMYFAHRSHAPQKLIRVSSTSWTFGTYVRTADPFGGANDFPGAVTFYEGRSVFASTNNNPDTIWASRSPTTAGVARHDDYTTGADADHAIIFPIGSTQGDIAFINWLAGERDFIALGTTGGVKALDGGGVNDAITPTNKRVRPLDPYGVQGIMPLANGETLFYMQKGSRILRRLEYEILADSFRSVDQSFVASHLTFSGVIQMAFQRGRSDILWMVRNDGVLIGITLKTKDDTSGWHRHVLGGTDVKVLSVAVEPLEAGYDRVWIAVERTINGVTVRYNEFFTEPFEGFDQNDFFTGEENETADVTAYENEVFEAQKDLTYLDSFLTLDTSVISGTPTCTPGATTGTGVNFSSSGTPFAATDVGKKIIKKYQNRVGGGVAIITAFVNTANVTCTIQSDFDNVSAMAAGDWWLTTDSIGGLHHLEGETVQVVTDGRTHPEVTVANGEITLDRQSGVTHIGYRYLGIFVSLALVLGSDGENILTDQKNVTDVDLLFAHSIGAKFGTDIHDLRQITSSRAGQFTDRPPLPLTGVEANFYEDTWKDNKKLIVFQDQPYPVTLTGANLTLDAGER
jgi:hypothetical protein